MSDSISSGGLNAILSTLKHVNKQSGILRGSKALALMNNTKGFDCPGCAWPEPKNRSVLEFCENGAKALMSATTTRVVDEAFFKKYSLDDLNSFSDHDLDAVGRIVTPAVKMPNDTHFRAISYNEAFQIAASYFKKLNHADEAVFYTSGRASNEAAFLYQLFARFLGTNNLSDCSNLCHESSGVALNKTIGIGKGTVQIEDFLHADVIFLIGHNPSTNHPRMLSTLREAKERGARIVVINPLIEPGLLRFRHPQKMGDFVKKPFELATDYFQVKVGGDAALFYLLLHKMINDEEALDKNFISNYTEGFLELKQELDQMSLPEMFLASGLKNDQLLKLYELIKSHERVIYAWGMGITQTTYAVNTIEAITSLALLRGHIGKKGAGLCPVRGHSNVQGDRTVGINHKPSAEFLELLSERFKFNAPSKPGLDVVDSIKAMLNNQVKIFLSLGGNFLSASPDYELTAKALNQLDLRISISTKLNRTHLLKENCSLLLPTLTRVEKDLSGQKEQIISVENSMSIVHASRGHFNPIRPGILSEPMIIAGLAQKCLANENDTRWENMSHNYALIRDHMAAIIPELKNYNERLGNKGGFLIPNPAHSRIFNTKRKRAQFMKFRPLNAPSYSYDLMLATIRSHDQFNTAIYGLNDRYRGIKNQRDVIFMNTHDIKRLNLSPDMRVNIVCDYDGIERIVSNFQVKEYEIKEGCAAAYFPEANALIPIGSVAHESNTPTSKQIPIKIQVETQTCF